jgi:hypothetical protein
LRSCSIIHALSYKLSDYNSPRVTISKYYQSFFNVNLRRCTCMKKDVTKMLPLDLLKKKNELEMCIPTDVPHFDLARWSHGDHDEIFRRGLHMVELSCPTDQARCPTCLPSLSVVTYRLFNFSFLFH